MALHFQSQIVKKKKKNSSIRVSNKPIHFIKHNTQRFCTNQTLVRNVVNQNIFVFSYAIEIITHMTFNTTFLKLIILHFYIVNMQILICFELCYT